MTKHRLIAIYGLGLFLVDRLTKLLILKLPQTNLAEGVFLNNQIGLKFYLNPGIAFSLPLPNLLSILLIIIIIIGLINLYLKAIKRQRHYLYWPLTLIIIGAISNLIDRIRFGGVIDFISISYWPAFNLADCYIVGGILLFLHRTCLKRYFSAEASKTVTGEDEAKQDFSK